ncbi:hypothetical protein [Legionella waltersii]|uniref:Uncharacterized protein n=1 Tax=Legionella waltersii TaxID=66969 RepID=A0A0W1AM90_9GAMM|nr:hypothetical protein [Legionella waltersii]KTD82275.1 hypothetical protein Lwal_0752 [Legionella waltersii]SNV04330.1 Uncharacterised protein [Legionella waltersii]
MRANEVNHEYSGLNDTRPLAFVGKEIANCMPSEDIVYQSKHFRTSLIDADPILIEINL